jgi:sec-independent protein translocase protein TatC
VFIVAAVLTPSPDWVSQVILGVPMVALYLLGIAAAWLFGGSTARGGEPSSETALARVPERGQAP